MPDWTLARIAATTTVNSIKDTAATTSFAKVPRLHLDAERLVAATLEMKAAPIPTERLTAIR